LLITWGRLEIPSVKKKLKRLLESKISAVVLLPQSSWKTLLEFPKKSIWEIYDLAREREKFRYAKPRAEEIPENVVDKLDDILADFRKCELWFEAIHREGIDRNNLV